MNSFKSWGRYPHDIQEELSSGGQSPLPLVDKSGRSLLAVGLGRSYGDSCLNYDNYIFRTERLNKFLSFDPETGVLRCQSGVTLSEILDLFVNRGWFPPVVPGTKFVTVGGAVANDIHGKNHHRAGTFGCHVLQLGLLRSDSHELVCSLEENKELFKATIGGLGLTGLITWVEFKLKPIASQMIDSQLVKFSNLEEFFRISQESESGFEYTAAWLDCLSSGKSFGRGIFFRGNHSQKKLKTENKVRGNLPLMVPFELPISAVNRLSVKLFNELYYRKQLQKVKIGSQNYQPFFFPLDDIKNWNRLYGPTGFLQFQCVLPKADSLELLRQLLKDVVASKQASFLAVAKEFGEIKSPGLMSFPRPGVTLCSDFAFKGGSTLDLFAKMEKIVLESGGALYPAKDACMSSELFKQAYPAWQEFSKYIDPKFSSSFWRRVS